MTLPPSFSFIHLVTMPTHARGRKWQKGNCKIKNDPPPPHTHTHRYWKCRYINYTFLITPNNFRSRDSSVSIVTVPWAGWSGFASCQGQKIFFFLQNVETSCWAHAALFHCVPGAYSQGLKWPGSEAEVKNKRNCTSSFPVCLIHGRHMDSLTIYIYQIVIHKQVSRIPTPLIFMEVTLGVSTC